MLPDLNRVIEQVSKEKGIDRQIIVEALERRHAVGGQAAPSAARSSIEAQFNPEIGEVELFEIRTVVDHVDRRRERDHARRGARKLDPEAEVGDELLAKLPPEKFGRIAAQAAKQNIIQRVRDAERDIIYNEFKDRKGELVSGIVQRFEKKNIIVNLGRTDAILPEKEQIPRERYRQGDRIRAFILDVELTSKGPQIVLSRTHPGLADRAVRAGGAGDLRGHRRGEGRGARARRAGEDRGHVARSRRRSRSAPASACAARACRRWCRSCAARRSTSSQWTADPAEYVVPRAGARQGVEDHHGRGRARHGGDRSRRPAVAGDRQEGTERPPGVAPDRLEARRAQRVRGRGRGASRARVADRRFRASATSPPSCSTSTASSRRKSSRRRTRRRVARSTASGRSAPRASSRPRASTSREQQAAAEARSRRGRGGRGGRCGGSRRRSRRRPPSRRPARRRGVG